MSKSARQIVNSQEQIIEAMGRIRVMRRGTLSQQAYPERAKRNNGKGAVGPYGLWQGTVGGQRFGKRVSGVEAEQISEGIAQRHVFEALCEKYVELSCRLGALECEQAAAEQAVKKGLESRSNRTRKSNG